MSYFFSQLYNYPKIAYFLGVKFDSIFKYSGTRKMARIYSDGIFVQILKLITGMNLRVTDKTRFAMIQLQREFQNEINMEPYFEEINNRELTVMEFEYFLSKIILIETNKIYNMLDKDLENELLECSKILFDVLNCLSGCMYEGIKVMMMNIKKLYKISKILKTIEEPKRILLFGPQLSLVTNFSKMLMKNKNFNELEPWNFLDLQTKFFVFEEHTSPHQLIFLERDIDKTNGESNRAFGSKYITCPGSKMTIDFIKSTLLFLQSFDIQIKGTAIFEGFRFKNFINKHDVTVKFTRN